MSSSSTNPDLARLTDRLLQFRDERDWQQFHQLKDLILSLNLEAAEMLELCQWKRDEELDQVVQDPEFRQKLEHELADVLVYLLLIAERTGIDLIQAADAKIDHNAAKYPADRVRGRADKYTAYSKKS